MEYHWYWFTQDGCAWLCEMEDGEMHVRRDGLLWRWSINAFADGVNGYSLTLHGALMAAEREHTKVRKARTYVANAPKGGAHDW